MAIFVSVVGSIRGFMVLVCGSVCLLANPYHRISFFFPHPTLIIQCGASGQRKERQTRIISIHMAKIIHIKSKVLSIHSPSVT